MHIIIDSGQLGLSLFLRSFPPSIRTQTHFKVIYIFVPILTVLAKKQNYVSKSTLNIVYEETLRSREKTDKVYLTHTMWISTNENATLA